MALSVDDMDQILEAVTEAIDKERQRTADWIYHVGEHHPGLNAPTRDALHWLAGKIEDGDEVPNPNAPAPRDA